MAETREYDGVPTGEKLGALIRSNVQLVKFEAGRVAILMPRICMTREECANLAAWLVAVSDTEDAFNDILAGLDRGGPFTEPI
jgi:hypothetical protein